MQNNNTKFVQTQPMQQSKTTGQICFKPTNQNTEDPMNNLQAPLVQQHQMNPFQRNQQTLNPFLPPSQLFNGNESNKPVATVQKQINKIQFPDQFNNQNHSNRPIASLNGNGQFRLNPEVISNRDNSLSRDNPTQIDYEEVKEVVNFDNDLLRGQPNSDLDQNLNNAFNQQQQEHEPDMIGSHTVFQSEEPNLQLSRPRSESIYQELLTHAINQKNNPNNIKRKTEDSYSNYCKSTQIIDTDTLIKYDSFVNQANQYKHFFTKLEDYIKCPICFNIALNPYECIKCEHIVCGGCLDRLKARLGSQKKTCPQCKYGEKPADKQETFKTANRIIKSLIDETQISCPNKYKYQNQPGVCEAIFKIADLKKHMEKECSLRIQKCKQCSQEAFAKDFAIHSLICKPKY